MNIDKRLAEIVRTADSIAARARAIGGLLLHDKRPSKHMTLASEVAIVEIEPLARHIAKLAEICSSIERLKRGEFEIVAEIGSAERKGVDDAR